MCIIYNWHEGDIGKRGGGGEGLASNKISTIFNNNTIHISGFLKFDFYFNSFKFKSIFSFLRCFVWHVLLLPKKNEKSNLRGYGKISLPSAAPRC
jgi:hypothetical protein